MSARTLFIMRHGKSDWSTDAASDFERPLNARGQNDAPAMAAWLKSQAVKPELLVSSPARRAAETARLIGEGLGINETDIVYEAAIYEAGRQQLLDALAAYVGDQASVMLCGHNPGLDAMVEFLARESPPLTAAGKLMTTAAIAVLEREGDWCFERGDWQLQELKRPKAI